VNLVIKIQNIEINAATTKQKQYRKNTTKPQTNTFSKYCKDNTKKVLHKVYTYYTRPIQQTVGKITFAHIRSHF
jgi:predicted transcriptional regulator